MGKISQPYYNYDTCARCYNYMPNYVFATRFKYRGYVLINSQNETFIANPANFSQNIVASFMSERYANKWKECCLAAVECCNKMTSSPPWSSNSSFCPRTWDGWLCWPDTQAGVLAKQPCPSHIYWTGNPPSCPRYAEKKCLLNNTWFQKFPGKEWTEYNKCGILKMVKERTYFLIGSFVVSVIALIPAIIIFFVYRQFHLPKYIMHKNLFTSLLLNAVVVIVFNSVFKLQELRVNSETDDSVLNQNGSGCKILLILTKYFRMTTYMWMFCEGFYLHKLIVAAFAKQTNMIVFYVTGWVSPALIVGIYGILRKILKDERCWSQSLEPYEWILTAPNLLSLVFNLLFLCNIIRVLVMKMRAVQTNELNQYRTAVKATMALFPLFGVHLFLVSFTPQSMECEALNIYYYFQHSIDGLQGFLVALIFCYLNREVLDALTKSYIRYKKRQQTPGHTAISTKRSKLSMSTHVSYVQSQ
ncbi:calcitonin gene-related peptide type 1 receptor-like [Limulus polyphemus]|uniref:Calcitonin gene-related peptide type 1 receptor-like n=1 Tax=Limulus polyphemus TaxID=6850 RepID=A0ABM1SA25_LIMPO|nr:calcitonin gene-related peptide type 1 receptor-like [Limulus polyphemus]